VTTRAVFAEVKGRSPAYFALVAGLGFLVALGLTGAIAMEREGHHITGMTNRIVWGMPHVFAVFLIVAASGALNVAALGSVFGRSIYKPLARLSGVLAFALLAGGLAVLVLDLGRPDRLIVAMTHYNFRSIFAWNIFLYMGFFAVIAAYLWLMMDSRLGRDPKPVGVFAMVWRLVLTTGTGSIFGFLVARPAYDSAIMGPLFVAMSLAFGQAAFLLILLVAARATRRPLGGALLKRMKNLLGIFLAVALYFVVVQHLTALYAPERQSVVRFLVVEGGVYPALFWIGQVGLGALLPLALVFHPATARSRAAIAVAAALALIGGLAQIYIIIIGGQALPQVPFPGMIVEGGVLDGRVAAYAPSLPEIALGAGGVALALLMVALAVKVLPLLPESLADDAIDPHRGTRPAVAPGAGAAA
jgi:molybdopterin-containing oxidoreductase family membrane subunit